MADEPPELTVRWDAELRRLGRAAVIARLENGGAHANSDYKLFVSGLRDPLRGYVERWLARQEEASEKAARARHDQSMRRSTFAICVSVLALLIAMLALWRKW
jgi:hypothetical protein